MRTTTDTSTAKTSTSRSTASTAGCSAGCSAGYLAGYFAVAMLGLGPMSTALADSKTVIETSPEKYSEKTRTDDGEKTKLEIDRETGSQVYKDSNGVVIKERTEDGKIKQDYKDDDCERSARQDVVTGNSRVVSKGDCPQ